VQGGFTAEALTELRKPTGFLPESIIAYATKQNCENEVVYAKFDYS
jgi:hypothetical protein